MISLKGVQKTFNRGKANEVMALRGIDLEIPERDFVVIVGSNGSGKTTLLNTISASVLPSAGEIFFSGENVTTLPEHQRSRWVARVFQNPLSGTAPDLSILDNFRLAALRTSAKSLKIGVDEKFRNAVRDKVATLGLGLENKINQPIGTLSGGQRQALTLLMSVMDECKILLLDEPTAALDPRSAEVVMKTADDLIKQYSLTAILITHNLKDAFRYGNRLIQMAEGQIVKDIPSSAKQSLSEIELYSWFM
ncbi:MAG: ATP-binding cassette protein [Sphingobacteriaceae bacterium]|jgi:putative ABC transport system ATP-binding protein|nr:ATP-binding cassette protein [Sphingobacteriaceae bacterium]